ncbi:MAG TPA: hypothetical protein V6D15_18395 [Oculatellaceae cyanobacterium]|jgi:GTPase SAR1 family protein
MSRLVNFQNRIRRFFSTQWLTTNQKQTYDRLRQLLSFQDSVNLYGQSGVGKTFLIWVLSKEVSTDFYSNWEQLEEKEVDSDSDRSNTTHATTSYNVPSAMPQGGDYAIAVVDPHPWRRDAVRQTLSTLHRLGYRKIIIVSDEPVADQIPSCQLTLAQSDLGKIYQNWSEVSIPVDELPESFNGVNLHQALCSIALSTLVTPGSDRL